MISCRLFGFGNNEFGQIGNADAVEEFPVIITTPSKISITKIFCGPEISAFLAGNSFCKTLNRQITDDGGMYLWGKCGSFFDQKDRKKSTFLKTPELSVRFSVVIDKKIRNGKGIFQKFRLVQLLRSAQPVRVKLAF